MFNPHYSCYEIYIFRSIIVQDLCGIVNDKKGRMEYKYLAAGRGQKELRLVVCIYRC